MRIPGLLSQILDNSIYAIGLALLSVIWRVESISTILIKRGWSTFICIHWTVNCGSTSVSLSTSTSPSRPLPLFLSLSLHLNLSLSPSLYLPLGLFIFLNLITLSHFLSDLHSHRLDNSISAIGLALFSVNWRVKSISTILTKREWSTKLHSLKS